MGKKKGGMDLVNRLDQIKKTALFLKKKSKLNNRSLIVSNVPSGCHAPEIKFFPSGVCRCGTRGFQYFASSFRKVFVFS